MRIDKNGNWGYHKNHNRISYNDFLPIEKVDGKWYVKIGGKSHHVINQVHTHPNTQKFYTTEIAAEVIRAKFFDFNIYIIRTDNVYRITPQSTYKLLGTRQALLGGAFSLFYN